MRLALPLRELEEVQSAFDVDVMRGDRCEFGSRRQKRGEMEDAIDLELREDPLEQARVGDRARERARRQRRQLRIQRRDVERDDGRGGGGEAGQEAVADFAARPRNEHDRFTHLYAAGRPILAECHA